MRLFGKGRHSCRGYTSLFLDSLQPNTNNTFTLPVVRFSKNSCLISWQFILYSINLTCVIRSLGSADLRRVVTLPDIRNKVCRL